MLTLGPLEIAAPAVMGILNVTPDSFSDGGHFDNLNIAIRQAATMAEEGAFLIDIGGESTRPGAASVPEQEELDRVIPVVEAVRSITDVAIITRRWSDAGSRGPWSSRLFDAHAGQTAHDAGTATLR
jgi:dihydropteroate synthase